MSVLTPEQTSKAQWSWLVSTLTDEMAAGKRLTLVKDVRRSLSLWTEYAPAVGVQLMDVVEKQYSTSAHLIECTFVIQVAAQSTATTSGADGYTVANLDDAMLQADTIVSDGAGNGVCSILRDPNNRTLGGNAGTSRITGIHYQADVSQATDSDGQPTIWAHAFIDFVTLSKTAIQ